MGYILSALAVIILGVAGFIGWVMNIIAVVGSGPLGEWAGMEIMRIVGVVIPLIGAVLGYV